MIPILYPYPQVMECLYAQLPIIIFMIIIIIILISSLHFEFAPHTSPCPQVMEYLYGNLFGPGELKSIYTAFANLASKGADDSSPHLAQDRDPDRGQPRHVTFLYFPNMQHWKGWKLSAAVEEEEEDEEDLFVFNTNKSSALQWFCIENVPGYWL